MSLKMCKIIVCVAAVLSAAPAAAQSEAADPNPPAVQAEATALTDAEVKVILLDALRGNGCEMDEDQARDVLPQLGLTKRQTRTVVDAMVEAGEATVRGDTLSLTDQTSCSAPEAADTGATPPHMNARAVLIEAFEANGCVLDEPQAEDAFEVAGLDPRILNDLAEAMFDVGEMEETEDRRKVRLLVGDVCGPEPESLEATAQGVAESQDPRSLLIAAFEANNCIMTEDGAEALVEAGAASEEDYQTAARAMLGVGEVTVDRGEEGARLVIGPVCGPDAPVNGSAEEAVIDATVDPRGALFAVFEANDCFISMNDLEDKMIAVGFDEDGFKAVASPMRDSGALLMDLMGAGAGMTLKVGDVCGADAGAAPEAAAQPTAAPALTIADALRRRDLSQILERAGCALDAAALAAATRYSYAGSAPLDDTIEPMIADGLLQENDDVYTLTNGEICP